MSKIIKSYFRHNVAVSQLLMVGFPILTLLFAIELFTSAYYTLAGLVGLVTLLWIPFSLVNGGIVKYRGMGSTIIDLALYKFDSHLSFTEDLSLTEDEASTIDKLFLAKIKHKADHGEKLATVRKVGIDEDLSAKLYFALIGRTILAMGEIRGSEDKNTPNSSLKDKIEEIKKKLKGNEPTIRFKSDDGESSGKYGFL